MNFIAAIERDDARPLEFT